MSPAERTGAGQPGAAPSPASPDPVDDASCGGVSRLLQCGRYGSRLGCIAATMHLSSN
jgi:hypothetical protein